MKKLFLLLSLFQLLVISISAQVELDKEEKFEFQSNYEFATGKNYDTKSILKLTTNGNLVQNNNLELSYEHKLNESISLSGGIIGERYLSAIFQDGNPIVIGGDTIGTEISGLLGYERVYRFQAYLEGRYYINQSYLIGNGYGNNVNGLYASLGVGSVIHDGRENNDPEVFTYLGLGVQSRILKNGILDFNLLLQYKHERISFGPTVRAGFALSKNYKNLEFNNARCNILKCFEERNYQLKLPLNGLMFMAYTPDWNHGYVSVQPRIKFEHRLFKGFSFNHTLSYSSLWNVNTRNELSIRRSGPRFGYENNLRWYFLKARNIASGKSADNLSGFYAESLLGINLRRSIRVDFMNPNDVTLVAKSQELRYGFNLGYQTRLFKRLYVDIKGYLSEAQWKYVFVDPDIGIHPEDSKSRRYGISLEFGFLF